MDPELVRQCLAAEASAPSAAVTEGAADVRDVREAAPEPRRAAAGGALYESIAKSYFTLRIGLAALAFLFPIALWLWAGPEHLQSSISAYYHFRHVAGGESAYGAGAARDLFVGVLWAIGAFLFFYKGYSSKENIALNVAGVAAVFISLFPKAWPDEATTFTNTVHFTSAVTFFLAIAYVCLFRPGDTLPLLRDEAQQRRFKRLYALLCALMVGVPLGLFALHLLADSFGVLGDRADESRVVLWVEIAGIWVFSAFWLAKSREIAQIERQGG